MVCDLSCFCLSCRVDVLIPKTSCGSGGSGGVCGTSVSISARLRESGFVFVPKRRHDRLMHVFLFPC